MTNPRHRGPQKPAPPAPDTRTAPMFGEEDMTPVNAPPPLDDSDPLFGKPANPQCPECGAFHKPSEPHAAKPTPSKALVPQTEARPGVFVTKREGFAEVEVGHESTAIGAQTKAEIAARTIHAINHPRSFDEAYAAIMRDCARPGFAKAAMYSLPPRGESNKRIEGLSIRFAEAALVHWGNVSVSSHLVSEDAEKRVVRITVGDLQGNVQFERDIVVFKIVERARVKPGQEPLAQRINSKGEIVFTVKATEEEVQQAEARERSRVVRNEGLRLIPADVKEEAIALCRETGRRADAKDPDAERKRIVLAFADLGIKAPDLAAYIGCDVSAAQPAHLQDLRDVFVAIRDGDATWQEFVGARAAELDETAEEPPSNTVTSIKERAAANSAARKAAATP